jgi:hypothetical protein
MPEPTQLTLEDDIAATLHELRNIDDKTPERVLIRKSRPGEYAVQGFHRGEKYPEARIINLLEDNTSAS